MSLNVTGLWSLTFSSQMYSAPNQVPCTVTWPQKTRSLLVLLQRSSHWPVTARQSRMTSAALSYHQHSSSLCPTPLQNAEASLLLRTQSCSTPWPCNVPHYRAVRKLLGALVTLKDWWRKMGWGRGEEQVVKKRMSCLMGCQECNLIIMKSDSGELAGWMDGWMVTEEGREANSPEHAWASWASWSSKNDNPGSPSICV